MVSYASKPERDLDHEQFIERLKRRARERIFETHARDIEQAARRCAEGTFAPASFLTLLKDKLESLAFYAPGGGLERELRVFEHFIAAVRSVDDDVFAKAPPPDWRPEDEDAAPGSEPEPPEPGTGEVECATPQSDSGTPFANSSFESEAKKRKRNPRTKKK